MMRRLLERWRKPRVISLTDFTGFLDRNAWLVTQKSIIGYCTVKTRLPVHELLKEKAFSDAYSVALWDSYAAVLADLMDIALTYSRASSPAHSSAWAERLGDWYESLITSHPIPAHRTGLGWAADIAAVRARLSQSLDGPRRQIREISAQCAHELFTKLPIHSRLRDPDEPAVTANVQFLMVGLAHEFDRIDFSTLTAELVSEGRP